MAESTESDPRSRPDDDYAHLRPLLRELVATGRGPARDDLLDALVGGFLPVVRNISRRYTGRGEPLEDLQQVGAIGLVHALDRFAPSDPDEDLVGSFLRFAVPTVTGEMRHHVRDRTWSVRVPRRLKDLQLMVRQAVTDLSATLGRAPRPSEIAARLEIPVGDVVEAIAAAEAHTSDSLDELIGSSTLMRGAVVGRVDATLAGVEYRDALRRALARLPAREREIVVLRFFGDLTQTEIARQTGISQMHVSRTLRRALPVLRSHLEPQNRS